VRRRIHFPIAETNKVSQIGKWPLGNCSAVSWAHAVREIGRLQEFPEARLEEALPRSLLLLDGLENLFKHRVHREHRARD